MAYFDAKMLPTPRNEYICFLDIMGMQAKMLQSLKQACNMIFKLHATIIEILRKSGYSGISVYPSWMEYINYTWQGRALQSFP